MNALEVLSHHSLVRPLLIGDLVIVTSLSLRLCLHLDRVAVLDDARVLNGRNIAAVVEGFHLGNGRCVLGEAITTKVDVSIRDGLDHG